MDRRTKGIISGMALAAAVITSCRMEDPAGKPSIEKIRFAESRKTLAAGGRATVALNVEPSAARTSAKVEYGANVPGIIVIDEENSSNEGVVFQAADAGSVVIVARVNGLADYCDITVEGGDEAVTPYIALTDNVLEIPVGRKKHVAASLQGGAPGDQNNFVFRSDDDRFARMEYANNTAVIEGVKTGSARITAAHPKAQYGVDVLAFVLNEGETAKYITGENVVFMELGGGTREYSVRMAGLAEEEGNYCIYEVIEGRDVVSLLGDMSGQSCTIEAKKAGVAKVRVVNQAAEHPFEFQVVVRDTVKARYVSASESFCIIDGADTRSISVVMEGGVPDDYINNFTYELSDSGIVSVAHLKDNFVISGITNGTAVLAINNKYSDFACEILLVARNQGGSASSREAYIRTSQQVVQMEVGGPDALLKMELVGGVEADKNNFEWVVEDSAIITAEAPGRVSYARTAAGAAETSAEAEAVITAKKAGTTRVRVYNAKALNEVTVLVKVYPKGTFNGQAIYIGGPGIIRVREGESKDVYAPVLGGNVQLLGSTSWESRDSSIAEIDGSGLHGSVTGVKSGVTRLRVTGDNLAQDYEAVVVAYREGEEDLIPYIYADSLFYRITVGQTVRVPVHHPNIKDNDFSFSVVNSNKDSVYHVVSGDVILVNGYGEGAGELVISTADANCNNLTLHVIVEPEKLDAARPYMLTGDNFLGAEEGGAASYTVSLAGAGAGKLNGITYSTDDGRVARVRGKSGNTVEIEGLAKGQTVLRINHTESMNEKAVVLYVVAKGESAEGKIVIGIETTNYVMAVNQSLFLRLVTNAGEAQKLGFRWKTNYADKVHIDDNYDTAVITAKEAGNVKVTVYEKDGRNVIDLDIFITIKEQQSYQGELGYPDSVILVKNQYKAVKGNAVGIARDGVKDVEYNFEEQGIASLIGGGLEVTLRGEEAGRTFLTVTSGGMNYYKKILVICVENENDLDNVYYFTVDKALHRIKTGDEIKVNLTFGENGFPETEKALIQWRNTSGNDAVLISPNGGGASVVGRNEGQAVIQITSRLAPKPVEVVVEVGGDAKGSDYYRFVCAPIHQTVKDAVTMLPVSIYYGNDYYDQDDRYNPGMKMETGYSGIEVAVADASVAEAAMAGQSLRVNAKKAGRTEITLSHGLIAEDAKLLVAVYEGAVPPAGEDLIIYAPKKHWLIPKGQTQAVTLITSGDAGGGGILWNNRNPALFTVDSGAKTAAKVTALKEGSGTVAVEYGGKLVETIYVSVPGDGDFANAAVATESVIILSKEELHAGYTTRIVVNGGSESGITWEAADTGVISVTGLGTSCQIWPAGLGVTELEVKGNGFRKTIIVKVVDTEAEKLSARLMNLDQRYFKLKKGQSVTLNPYYKADKPSGPAEAELVYDNRVVQVEKSGGGIAVTGKNVGVERLRLWNAECENGLEVTFEVDETASGGVGEVMNLAYMTAQNGVIIMEPGAKDYYVPVSVIGEYAGSEADFKWKSSSANVQVSGMGAYAFVSAGNKEGEADITVSNRHCAGELKIKVIVGKKFDFENNDVPYLYAERNVYTVDKGGGGLVIPLEIRNVSPVDYNKVSVACSGSAVTAKFANGSLAVAGMDAGVGTITAKYEGVAQALTVYVIVREGGKGGTAYLTTGQNYVIVNKNDTRVVDVSLVNYTEPDSSAYKWSSGDASIAHVIGNGRTVQILGMNEGVTKVTVKHPESYNDLDILVKVAPAGSAESVCYLTTGDNVIETYVSTNSSEITVNKVGGKTAAADAVWSVDDPTVVGIMGSGSACYYTPKKAGIAKITASDREAGSLSIVVIVRKTKPGDQFIMARENVKQITPGSTNNALSVYLTDGEDIDERDFKWEIYSQLPGSVEVARQGGSVISLFGMGSRATVGGIYAGTAKVKVTHPKAAQALFLVVQVTNFASMRFGQRDVVIASEDMTYVTLETPDYENYAGKVKFSTDNPAVCTVVGSSKAALLSARQAGKAVITAYVEGTDLKAETAVTVVPEMSFNQPDIVTGKTTYPLNPREKPFVISASILGFGVGDQDNDSLVWKVKGIEDYKKPMIKIYPENYEYDDGPGVIRKGSQGRHIQVEVLNRKYETPENCIIEISCPSLTSKVRTVFLQVQEDSNAFTVSKRSLTVQSGEMAELSCSIIGGSNKDYEEVVWVAQKDGFDPTKDIVKVMGRGRSVQVLGMADGVTNVTAVYRGLMDNCAVVVKSSVYFNIQYQYFLKYPKARNDDGGLVEIGYEVRPVTAPIQWIDTDGDSAKKIANYSVTQAKDDGDGTGRGVILFDFLREGTFTLMGISNSKSAKVIITVQNIYHFGLQPHFIDQTPTDYAVNRNDKPRTRADNTVNYTVSPGNARIAVKGGNAAINSLLDKGVEVEIGKAVSGGGGDLRSSGVIYVNNKREIIGDTVITFELLTPEGEPAGYEQELTLTSRYPKGVARLVPVFERVYGQYSNSGGAKNYPIANRKGDKDVSQSNLPTGVNYNAGQYLKPVSIPSYNASSHTDTYELVIGDGEEHYILLDKLNNNAAIEVSKIEYVSNGDVLGAPGRMPSGAEVKSADKNSLPSFKISGGKDYIVYDYFGTNFDLTCTLSSGNAGRDYYYVSIPTSYTNTDHGLSTSLSDFNKDNIVGSASPVNDGKVVAYYYYDGNSLSYVNYVVYGGSMGSYTGGSPSPGYTTGNYRYSMKTNGVFYLLTSDGKYVKYENIPYNIYSSKLIQTYSYVSQAINATETRWNPVTNEYSGGNIRVSLGHGYNMVGGKFVSYMDVYPKVLSGSYEVDFASDNPRTPWGMSGNCGLIVEGGEKRIRNFITGRTYTWGSGDPTEDKSKLTGNTPFDGIFYDNDPMYGGDGERGQVHIKISRGVYSKRVGNYYSNVITFQRILPFGMLNPESGNGDNFIVPLIDIFNERYEAAKETIPLGPKDFPEVDRENFEKYPYRYFPLPSTNFGLVYNRYKCGTITVEYNTAYATGSEKSKIIIGVYHEVRQCAANYINERERIAMGWNELERVAIPKGFKDPVYKDDSSIYNGKLWMPKNY